MLCFAERRHCDPHPEVLLSVAGRELFDSPGPSLPHICNAKWIDKNKRAIIFVSSLNSLMPVNNLLLDCTGREHFLKLIFNHKTLLYSFPEFSLNGPV